LRQKKGGGICGFAAEKKNLICFLVWSWYGFGVVFIPKIRFSKKVINNPPFPRNSLFSFSLRPFSLFFINSLAGADLQSVPYKLKQRIKPFH